METKKFQERFKSLKADLTYSINELLYENSLYERVYLHKPLVIIDGGGDGYNTVISSVAKNKVGLTGGYAEDSSYTDNAGELTFKQMSIEQMIYVHGELEAKRFDFSF